MVFQEPVLLDRTVWANLAYGLRRRGIRPVRSRVEGMLGLLGLEHLRHANARLLSGGEKKRTALGMALLLESPILLLDECFANLDPLSTRVLEDVLLSLKREGRRTVVLSTHSLDHARSYADYVYFLRDGIVAESGTPDQVFGKPASVYTALYVGQRNLFPAHIEEADGQPFARLPTGLRVAVATGLRGPAHIAIPAADVILSPGPFTSSARNCFAGRVVSVWPHGPTAIVTTDIGVPIEALITVRSLREMDIRPGMEVYLTWKASAVHVLREPAGA